jgi:hypothetical protein
MANAASTINAAIKTALEGIDGTGDYQNVIVSVNRVPAPPQKADESTDFPFINFTTLKYSEEAFDANGNIKHCQCEATLAFYVKYSDASTADADILDLYSDVKIALEADYTLGGLLLDSDVSACEVAEIQPDDGFIGGYCRFSYKFTHTMGDPT